MKKLILFMVCILIVSCEKKYCWKCAQYDSNAKLIINSNSVQCDMTNSEIQKYENDNTITQKVFNGNNYQTNVIKTCKCNQQ